MDASQLRWMLVFTEIAEAGSFTGAARTLGVSRSVVSEQLAELEESLGVRLLERTTRRLRVTQVGEHVLEASRRMVAAARDAQEAARAEHATVSGQLRVSCSVDLLDSLVLPALVQLTASHPKLRVDLQPSDYEVDIVHERLDVAVRVGVPSDSSFIMRQLARDDEIIVMSRTQRRHAVPKSVNHLATLPRVAHRFAQRTRTLELVHRGGRKARVKLGVPAIAVGHSGAMRELIAEGVGFGVLPRFMVRGDLDAGRLVRVLPAWRHRTVLVHALMPSRLVPRRTAVFLAALENAAAAAAVAPPRRAPSETSARHSGR